MDDALSLGWHAASDDEVNVQLDALEALIDQGADINYQHSATGITALMVAAAKGRGFDLGRIFFTSIWFAATVWDLCRPGARL